MSETEEQPADKKHTRVEIVEPKHGVYSFYANNIDAMWTSHDIKIKFRELVGIKEASDQSPRVHVYEERAAVILAWSEAKLAILMLADIIDKYEKVNGEIKIAKIP